jgi:hypothetical protein
VFNLFTWLKEKFRIKLYSEPKTIVLMDGEEIFKIPCYKAVVEHLVRYKDLVYEYQEEKKYGLANKLVFGHLKYYDKGLSKYDGIDKDLSVVIDYIYCSI